MPVATEFKKLIFEYRANLSYKISKNFYIDTSDESIQINSS